MFKKIFMFFLLFSSAFSLSISLNNGKSNSSAYYILHIQNERDFICKVKIGNEFLSVSDKRALKNDLAKEYHCFIEGKLTQQIREQHFPFMDLYVKPAKTGFWVIVQPKIKSYMLSIEGGLYEREDTKQENKATNNHYTIVLDENLQKDKNTLTPELNFDIVFPNLVRPNIGALDFNKEPLSTTKEGDIGDYLSIKNMYSQERYQECLENSLAAINMYPNSVFTSEFHLYHIRSLFYLNLELQKAAGYSSTDNDYILRIIDEAKAWVKNYASDRAYPEVLYMLMEAYLENGRLGEADYVLNLLLTEHEKSTWTKSALLAYADDAFRKDQNLDAIRLYEDVYYSTDNVDEASLAALRLANAYVRIGNKDKARQYLEKIIESNIAYFGKAKADSLDLANAFKEAGLAAQANEIYKFIFASSSKRDDEYEITLRNIALYPADDNTAEEIFNYLKLYQQDFPESDYMPLINTAIDKMFFNIDDNKSNAALHATYSELMEKYKGGEIGARALKEKVKLYFAEGEYNEVLALKNDIADSNETENKDILKNSASILANKANQEKRCDMLMLLIDGYEIEPNVKDRYKLFDCYMRQARFNEALATTTKGVEDRDLHTRIQWLSSASKALYALGDFEKSLKAANDAIYESKRIKYADPSTAIHSKFYSLLRLGRLEEALASIEEMKNVRGAHFLLIEMYDAAAKYASARALDSTALNYAKRTLEMQKQLKIDTFSPEIDFIFIESQKRMNDENGALESLLKLLNNEKLDARSKARALYMTSEIEMKKRLMSSATKHVDACLQIQEETPWKALCKQQKELIKE